MVYRLNKNGNFDKEKFSRPFSVIFLKFYSLKEYVQNGVFRKLWGGKILIFAAIVVEIIALEANLYNALEKWTIRFVSEFLSSTFIQSTIVWGHNVKMQLPKYVLHIHITIKQSRWYQCFRCMTIPVSYSMVMQMFCLLNNWSSSLVSDFYKHWF